MQPRRLLQALDQLADPQFRLVLGDRSDVPASDSLRAALASHVAELSDAAQRVLGVLALLGAGTGVVFRGGRSRACGRHA